MTRARFFYRFDIASLLVEQAVMHATATGVVDGRRVAILIPPDPRIFDRSIETPPSEPSSEGSVPASGEPRSVGAIQISVDAEVPVSAADVDLEADYRPAILISDEMIISLGIARRIVSGFVDWSRVALHQYGLGLGGEQPTLHEWQRILDIDANRFYPFAATELRWVSFTPADAAPVSRGFLDQILDGGYQEPPPVAYMLLADARHVAWRGDWSRAVLLAAMACELRVKQAIRDLTLCQTADHEDAAPVGRRRTRAVADLFDKPMLALAGRSLRNEDVALFKGVTALFETRNDVIHDGLHPTDSAGQRAIKSAVGAFQWLEAIKPPTTTTPDGRGCRAFGSGATRPRRSKNHPPT